MRFLLVTLAILFIAIWAGLKIAIDPGYALFAYQHWTVQMPLWVAGIILLAGFLLLHNLLLLIRGTGSLAKKIKVWSKQHRVSAAHRLTKRGLIDLAEGKWASAETLLVKASQHDNTPLVNYLAAARAAQEQGADERRDKYLRMAHESTPDSAIAIGLTQAQLQFSHQQLEHCLATLCHLQHLEPKNVYVLKMLKKLYVELNDWNGLLELLPELRKRKVFSPDVLTQLEQQAYLGLLHNVGLTSTPEAVNSVWERIPKSLRRDGQLILCYTQILLKQHRDDEAEVLIRDALKAEWQPELVKLYGLVKVANKQKQLETAESWLKSYGSNGILLLTLGRLCMRNGLWGQARRYLEAAVEAEPDAEAYTELGRLFEHIGEMPEALEQYRKGLLTSTSVVTF